MVTIRLVVFIIIFRSWGNSYTLIPESWWTKTKLPWYSDLSFASEGVSEWCDVMHKFCEKSQGKWNHCIQKKKKELKLESTGTQPKYLTGVHCNMFWWSTVIATRCWRRYAACSHTFSLPSHSFSSHYSLSHLTSYHHYTPSLFTS